MYSCCVFFTFIYQRISRLCVDKNPQQHVPLSEYLENLKEISRLLTSAGVSSDKVIFITPPPLHEAAWEKECILKGHFLWFPYLFSFWLADIYRCFSFRLSSQSPELHGRSVRSGLCPCSCSVRVRCSGSVDSHAKRWTSKRFWGPVVVPVPLSFLLSFEI